MAEHSGGFAIMTLSEDDVAEMAKTDLGPTHGVKDARNEMMEAGLIDGDGNITRKGWDLLNKDIALLERNALSWLKKTFGRARDEGHDRHNDLVGSFWFDPLKPAQAEMIVMGSTGGTISMTDASYGNTLPGMAWKGVSKLGEWVLGGGVSFFDIPKNALEEAETVADWENRARLRSRSRA
jgi:hypothetical protein